MNRQQRTLMIALSRLYRAAAANSPKTFFLLQHAQGVARQAHVNPIVNQLLLSEQNFTTSYAVNPSAPAFASVATTALYCASFFASLIGRNYVRYTVKRLDYALQIANKGQNCEFVCNFETDDPALAFMYAQLGNESARLNQRREEYNAVALDPLPVPEVKTIRLTGLTWEYLATIYQVGNVIVIYRQTDHLNHRVNDNCAMRLSKWNEYRADYTA